MRIANQTNETGGVGSLPRDELADETLSSVGRHQEEENDIAECIVSAGR